MNSVRDTIIHHRDQITKIDNWAVILLLLSISACTLSFAGDVTPPPNNSYPSQTVQTSDPISSQLTPEESQQLSLSSSTDIVSKISIAGSVIYVGPGEQPGGLTAQLQRIDKQSFLSEKIASTVVQNDGNYRFENVEIVQGGIMIVSVDYQSVTFLSDMVLPESLQSGKDVNLPINIYETTNSTSGLVAERVHVIFDLIPNDRLQVVEFFLISNPTDQYVLPPETGEPLLTFDLPSGATNLQFEDEPSMHHYVLTNTGFGDVVDIPPGTQAQLVFTYNLPIEKPSSWNLLKWFAVPRKELIITAPITVASLIVMTPDDSLRLQSQQLVKSGVRNMQGINFHLYTAENLQTGAKVLMTLVGKRPSWFQFGSGMDINVALGLLVFCATLFFAGYRLLRQRKQKSVMVAAIEDNALIPGETEETLLDSIIALDDLYTSGKIPVQSYQQRRAKLKEQLRELRDASNH